MLVAFNTTREWMPFPVSFKQQPLLIEVPCTDMKASGAVGSFVLTGG
jgi:hypothetical protein